MHSSLPAPNPPCQQVIFTSSIAGVRGEQGLCTVSTPSKRQLSFGRGLQGASCRLADRESWSCSFQHCSRKSPVAHAVRIPLSVVAVCIPIKAALPRPSSGLCKANCPCRVPPPRPPPHPTHLRHPHKYTPTTTTRACLAGFGAQVPYCTSKGALLPMAKSLAVAWGDDNIQAGCCARALTRSSQPVPTSRARRLQPSAATQPQALPFEPHKRLKAPDVTPSGSLPCCALALRSSCCTNVESGGSHPWLDVAACSTSSCPFLPCRSTSSSPAPSTRPSLTA